MTTDPRWRASDADRDRVADRLREHTGQGRLTLDEYAERVAAAYAAITRGDLDRLLADLPREPARTGEYHTDPPVTCPAVTTAATCLGAVPVACLVVVLVLVILA
jgi:hypothetical protein